jgi:hypothetical protein
MTDLVIRESIKRAVALPERAHSESAVHSKSVLSPYMIHEIIHKAMQFPSAYAEEGSPGCHSESRYLSKGPQSSLARSSFSAVVSKAFHPPAGMRLHSVRKSELMLLRQQRMDSRPSDGPVS